ncbi:hypothetical protein FB566_1697 [Stackebrandtia endophytica]|uniref:Uncharacterized protein n=1 Tax=Stackebrandtia endophytica TaxID=1496996 RepID=A0A543AUD2_9ACTN|nr:hypothetical protein [Stackebrandtia endophytica]TQL76176.1 hypothetical protein FB566_1697 [Stackebrandtia endophytica]
MAKKKPAPRRTIVLAQTGSGHWPHPVEVTLQLGGDVVQVGFSLGPHIVNAGGLVPLANVLDETGTGLNPMFSEEFDAAQLHWVIPYLARLHTGEDVIDEIHTAYRERHGKPPRIVAT